MRLPILFLLVLGACSGRGLELATVENCRAIEDARTCSDTTGCFPLHCASCDGVRAFLGCFGSSEAVNCPLTSCAACDQLDEAQCGSTAGCSPQVCAGCDGPYFERCHADGATIQSCPAIDCPKACDVLEEIECRSSGGCHAVYDGSGELMCDCGEPGCCTVFSGCASGPANCSDANLACRASEPYCDGPYVVSFFGQCYEGCVLAEDCP